jgi:hypothetical protein
MKILLIDADSTIPNLALMRISSYHKSIGDTVELLKLNISYYPNRKNRKHTIPIGYDKVYCSIVFKGSIKWICTESLFQDVEYGGSGYCLKKQLPNHIATLDPDYSIYPDNNQSYGFLSRGCIRSCSFCVVPTKEGSIRKVSSIDNIVRHKKVSFMDNNFLALKDHKSILCELIEKGVKCQFNQGLDIRLLDTHNSELLSKLNYMGEYVFAFDNIKLKNLIETKLNLLQWRKDWQIKMFVYVNKEMPLFDTINRIEFLRHKKILPYLMRDIDCWDSENSEFYIDLAAWCNQPAFFKKMDFEEFLIKRHKKQDRIDKSTLLYKNIE